TERKRAEEELTKSRLRYQQIFTQSKDAILIARYDGKLVDFNHALTELTGFSKEELEAMDNYHTLLRPEEQVNELLLKLKAGIGVKDFAIKVGRKNNEVRECIITANVLSEPDFEGYNCIIRDITEQVNAERLRKARDLARQSEKMKEQFIASVSHEMRTPMNAILGMSNILIQTPLNEEQYDLVKSIKQSSEILLGIVNDILEISAIQNGKITFEHDTFDLYDLLDNLVNVMQYKAQEKDLYFEVHIDPAVPRLIVGDKLRLNQILYNLVGNAIKFTDEGFVKIHVKKLHDIGDDSVQLKFIVEDSGIGIPEDKLDAIFDTFTRVRTKDRLYEGTGLGLSICKNLVEQQGGKIGVESKLGVGSKFFFDLIFEIGKEKAESESVPSDSDINFDPATPFRLLLVEDHKMNQLVATKTLERKFPNIELVLAENGKQAIERLEKEDFDIVLMDIQMPVMDGYEATAWIRKNLPPPKCDTPILAMTAHAYISKDEKFREHGMNDYVLKPFEPEDLFFKISKYINKGNHDE
ncbi:MAG: PAS domain-containing sensor histidine kinase, partial [Bacteroidetes bacterium]